MQFDYDVIVIGAGSGGLTAAIGFNNVGKKVLLIERDLMGGECTNSGCIPSKSLIHHARNYYFAKKYAGDTADLKKYRQEILSLVQGKVKEIRDHESPELIEKMGIDVALGTASFDSPHSIKVEKDGKKRHYSAKRIVISTGSSPRMIDISGLEKKHLLTNENLFLLKEIPQKLLIVGGGAIGCEMAQAFAYLGTEVTVATNVDRILHREEPEISMEAEKVFEELDIKIIHNSQVSHVSKQKAFIENKDAQQIQHEVEFDKVLIAIGRKPNVHLLDLDHASIKYSDRGIFVDHHYRTNLKHVFAVGDVSSNKKFTHIADDQSRHVIKKTLMPFAFAENNKPNPRVTYLYEEVASVGMRYEQACQKYGQQEVMKISLPYTRADRAKTDELRNGLAMVIVKRLTGRLLGASLIGKNAGELLGVFTVCIQHKVSLWKLNKTIFAYPVMGRIIKKLSDQFIAQSVRDFKKDLKHFAKKHLPKVIALLFWICVLTAFSRYKATHNLSSLDIVKQIYEFVTATTYGPLVYILIYAFRPLILFPATLLTLISGTLFGFVGGTLFTIIGENLSANLAYLMGRIMGKDIIPAEGMGIISSWKKKLQANSFISVMIMRLIYLPFDVVNFACGMFHVRWKAYALATFIGILPGLMTFVSLGASIDNVDEFDPSMISLDFQQLAISIILFVVSIILARYIKKRQKIKEEIAA